MNAHRSTAVCVTALVVGLQTLAYSQTASENTIRMNQIQVIGSHNSYHAGIAPSESRLFRRKISNSIRRLNTGIVLWINN